MILLLTSINVEEVEKRDIDYQSITEEKEQNIKQEKHNQINKNKEISKKQKNEVYRRNQLL